MKLHNSQILPLLSHIRLLPLRYSGRDITCKNKVNCFKSKIGFNAMFVLQRMTAVSLNCGLISRGLARTSAGHEIYHAMSHAMSHAIKGALICSFFRYKCTLD